MGQLLLCFDAHRMQIRHCNTAILPKWKFHVAEVAERERHDRHQMEDTTARLPTHPYSKSETERPSVSSVDKCPDNKLGRHDISVVKVLLYLSLIRHVHYQVTVRSLIVWGYASDGAFGLPHQALASVLS